MNIYNLKEKIIKQADNIYIYTQLRKNNIYYPCLDSVKMRFFPVWLKEKTL